MIEIAPTHRLVMITDETDWTELARLGFRRAMNMDGGMLACCRDQLPVERQ